MTLPKRDVPALIEALRIRAMALTGEKWELNATRDMMKEAADTLEELAGGGVSPQQRVFKALYDRVFIEHDDATHWPKGSERDGHKGEFDTCLNEDCVLVRAASPPTLRFQP